MLIFADIQLGLRLALRARFLVVGFWLIVALGAIVLMAAQFSGRQPATIALDIGLSAIRLALPVVLVMLMQELFSREFERRYYLSSLSYPRPRHALLLGRFIAAYGLTIFLLLCMAILLAVLVSVIGQGYAQATPVSLGLPYAITIAFISLDLLVLAVVANLLAIFATTPGFVLIGTLGFMLIARSFSAIITLLQRDGDVVANPERYQESLSLIGYLFPDLGALDVRMIALYNTLNFLPGNWPTAVVTALLYSATLLGVSLWLLNRRRFS
ncbi:MAG: hypothetical protein R6X15_03115 [Pseudomonadota bacterium]